MQARKKVSYSRARRRNSLVGVAGDFPDGKLCLAGVSLHLRLVCYAAPGFLCSGAHWRRLRVAPRMSRGAVFAVATFFFALLRGKSALLRGRCSASGSRQK